MSLKVGHELAEAERIEPRAELFGVPREHIARQPEHLQVGQPADARQVLRDRLAVELVLVQVLVAPFDEATVDADAGGALAVGAFGGGDLLLLRRAHPDVALPNARALQLEVVGVAVGEVIAPAFHLDASDVHLGGALHRLILDLILKPQPRPRRPSVTALQLEVIQIAVLLSRSPVLDADASEETSGAMERLGLNGPIRLERQPHYASPCTPTTRCQQREREHHAKDKEITDPHAVGLGRKAALSERYYRYR